MISKTLKSISRNHKSAVFSGRSYISGLNLDDVILKIRTLYHSMPQTSAN